MTAAPAVNQAVALVDAALDAYVARMAARGLDPEGFRAATLAGLAHVDTPRMSQLLQEYRLCQRREGATRYVVACHQYGAGSRWSILAKPNTDPAVVREARRAQALWAVKDAASRLTRDGLLEVRPGLRDSQADRLIDAAQRATETMLTAQLTLVQQLLEPAPDEPSPNGDRTPAA